MACRPPIATDRSRRVKTAADAVVDGMGKQGQRSAQSVEGIDRCRAGLCLVCVSTYAVSRTCGRR